MMPHAINHVATNLFKRWLRVAFATTVALLAFLCAAPQCRPDILTDVISDDEAAEQMIIDGRIIGPNDKSLASSQVAVVVYQYCRSKRPSGTVVQSPLALTSKLLAMAKTDERGRFRLSGRRYSPSQPYIRAMLFAAVPGYGFIAQPVDHARLHQDVIIKLQPELAIRGRLIDSQGQPASDVKLHYIGSAEQSYDREEKCVPFWPKPVTTDDKGRFLFRGLGLRKVTLETRHERFAPQRLDMDADGLENTKEVTVSVVAARTLRGRVAYADTGRPAPFVRLLAVALEEERAIGVNYVECRTDEQGRFRLNAFPGDYQLLVVHPPEQSPYRTLRKEVSSAQAARQQLNLALPRGISVRGTVIERSSGKPIAGARVQFRPRQNNNPFYRREFQSGSDEEHFETAISGPDGRFQLAVLPGPGHLLVLGPTLDYLPVETSQGKLEYSRSGGIRYYPDGLVALDIKPGTEIHEVTVELRRGVTFHGRVIGPDDRPVDRFLVLCRHYRPTGFQWWQRLNLLEGHDGQFELPGCDPDKSVTTWLLDPQNELGVTVELSVKQAAGPPPIIRLERCGSAVVRFANKDGKSAVKWWPSFSIVITPGAFMAGTISTPHDNRKDMEADWLAVPFWVHFPFWRQDSPHAYPKLLSDAQGRVTFPILIPGATYRIMLPNLPKGGMDEVAVRGWPTRDFTVKPSEKLFLPDVTIDPQLSGR